MKPQGSSYKLNDVVFGPMLMMPWSLVMVAWFITLLYSLILFMQMEELTESIYSLFSTLAFFLVSHVFLKLLFQVYLNYFMGFLPFFFSFSASDDIRKYF